MLNLEELNPNQRDAVTWSRGPLLVLAGPGSGKTKVLTMRAAKLIHDSPNQRFRVLCLTFTTKAATEMRNRLIELVPESQERVLPATFHAFCAEILRQHGNHVGLRPDFTILSEEEDRKAVLLDAIHQLQSEGQDCDDNDIILLPVINGLLDNFVGDEDVLEYIINPALVEKLPALYKEYKKQLLENNRVDFPSLLLLAYKLLASKSAIARQIQAVYTHICVDEFQDTNLAQYKLLKVAIGPSPRNLFVVADDDQIIYEWNGASRERLVALQVDFNMEVIQLPANYRCPPSVIELANRLISHNPNRTPNKEPLQAGALIVYES